MIGRRQHRRWFSRESFADKLARRAPDLDTVIVALDDKPTPLPSRAPDSRAFSDKWRIQLRGCLVAVVLCALITVIASQWLIVFDAANPGDDSPAWRSGGGALLRALAVGTGDGD